MLFAYLSTFGLPLLYAAKNFGRSCQPCTTWGPFAECACASWGPYAEFHPFSNWQTFFFGMCVGRMLQDINPENVPLPLRKAAAIVALSMLISLPLLGPQPSNGVSTLFFDKGPFLLPLFAVILYFVPLGEDVLLKPTLLQNKSLQYLGMVSGHLFLLHWPVRLLVTRATAGRAPVLLTLVLQLLVAVSVYEGQKALFGPLRSGKTEQHACIDNAFLAFIDKDGKEKVCT